MFPISFMQGLRAVRHLAPRALLCTAAFATTGAAAAELGDGRPEARTVTSVMVTGMGIADYWIATPAEYAATAESVLDAVGAPSMRRGTVTGSVAAELLTMFAGGGGAPQDVVRLRPVAPAAPAGSSGGSQGDVVQGP